ncbi:MAG TPA: LacI family DNA-binding transcriptional regulator [Chthoniobacterales bacterium]|jgi:DNA-binding LacI/PurR family transcriptional regulator|nr:LacI family DNA-binding transcriptional regulator [Chthoniobacterales bacterium]
MEATILSVAKLAGVAPSTVSHYIEHSAPVSPGTAQNAERAIAALSYRVNLGARSLRLRTTHSVGFVIPNIGGKAVELLLQRINEKERFANKAPSNVINSPLHVRGSTAAPAEGR